MTVELVRPGRQWWESTREVRDLGVWLIDSGRILSLTEAKDFLEKPRKWAPEREEMLKDEEMGRLHDEAMALEDEAFRDMERRSSL